MNTDLEQELRDLFHDKAGDAPVATPSVAEGTPRQVLRRARFRQVGTVVGSVAIAFAIAIGSVAGLNAILGGAEDRDRVGNDPSPSVFSPGPEPRADEISLSGGEAGHPWTVRFTGAFEDGSACIVVRVAAETPHQLCLGRDGIEGSLAGSNPSMHLWVLPTYTLLAGSIPPDVRDIRFVPDEGDARIVKLQCTAAPIGWADKQVCAIRLPRQGSGTMEYLAADGSVLFEEGIGWDAGDAARIPDPVEPVHGGTYWAVYVWLGASGDPEADDVTARLRTEFGIEAFAGELACDDGAAQAIGTDAPHGIAVYFETEADARDFVRSAGTLAQGAPIAQVTTYCLD
jgi:hypothetical protein